MKFFPTSKENLFTELSIPFLAFVQVTLFVGYLFLIAVFFNFVVEKLDSVDSSEFFAPIIMLLLFVMSAVISATLILGRAAVLFWNKDYKNAFRIILWDIVWGFTYLLIFVSSLYIAANR